MPRTLLSPWFLTTTGWISAADNPEDGTLPRSEKPKVLCVLEERLYRLELQHPYRKRPWLGQFPLTATASFDKDFAL